MDASFGDGGWVRTVVGNEGESGGATTIAADRQHRLVVAGDVKVPDVD
jgi:hypothetical protein